MWIDCIVKSRCYISEWSQMAGGRYYYFFLLSYFNEIFVDNMWQYNIFLFIFRIISTSDSCALRPITCIKKVNRSYLNIDFREFIHRWIYRHEFHASQSPLPPTDTLNTLLHLHDVTIHEVSNRMTRQLQELNSSVDTGSLFRDTRERQRETNCMVEGEKGKSNPKHHSTSIDTHNIANEKAQ